MFQKPSPTIQFESTPEGAAHHTPDSVETVVGPSMNVEGDFVSEGNIIIKGAVAGSITTSKAVHIEQGAKIQANVRAGNAVISGQVKGNIRVDDQLEITSSAQIVGDLNCKIFVVEAGALIQGKITMAGLDIEAPKTERRRPPRAARRNEDEMEEAEIGIA